MVQFDCINFGNCRLCHCNLGEYEFNEEINLIEEIYDCTHIKINDELMQLLPKKICKTCKDAVCNFYLYKQHIRKVDEILRKIVLTQTQNSTNNRDVEKASKIVPLVKFLTCEVCNKQFRRERNYKLHLEKHKKLHCSMCLTNFKTLLEYDTHLCEKDDLSLPEDNNDQPDLNIQQNVPNDSDNESLNCDTCGKTFDDVADSKIHKRMHKAKFICQEQNCGKVCTTAYTLKTHQLRHEGKRSFLCVTCGKGFLTKNSLTCHEKIHLSVKAYNCTLCNIGFSVRSNLRAHEKKYHEGVRFYCSQCTKEFVTKCSLERHERLHSGIREFQCQSCPSAFYTNKELLKHQRYHQGLRQHKCDECFKTFFEKHHLIIHLRSHTGERPYICKVADCGKSFADSQKLKRHNNAKHFQILDKVS